MDRPAAAERRYLTHMHVPLDYETVLAETPGNVERLTAWHRAADRLDHDPKVGLFGKITYNDRTGNFDELAAASNA